MPRNNHYVPQFILRNFGTRISTYNIKKGELTEGRNPSKVFSGEGIYPDSIEDELNQKIESQFGSFFANNLSKQTGKISLSRAELFLIKKFLIITLMRTPESQGTIPTEHLMSTLLQLNNFFPFEEDIASGMSDYDYWLRSLRVILETDGSPDQIAAHPLRTYSAYYWAMTINYGFLGFWDSSSDKDRFVITDIGMTSENEIGWNGLTVLNHIKRDFLINQIRKDNHFSEAWTNLLKGNLYSQLIFHENFMMFPISAKRMIVVINPFFRLIYERKDYLHGIPDLKELTILADQRLFKPNTVDYSKSQDMGTTHIYDPNDRYFYAPVRLTTEETEYCNALYLDRIDTWLGFSDLDCVYRSVLDYRKRNMNYVPRVNYDPLYKIIGERYPEGKKNV